MRLSRIFLGDQVWNCNSMHLSNNTSFFTSLFFKEVNMTNNHYDLVKNFWPYKDEKFETIQLDAENGHICKATPKVSDGNLIFEFECEFKDRKEIQEAFPEWYFEDHVVLLLNPGNDNLTQLMVAVTRKGEIFQDAKLLAIGEEPSDRHSTKIARNPLNVKIENDSTGNTWKLKVSIDEKELSGKEGGLFPLGFALKFGAEEVSIAEPVTWPSSLANAPQTPFDFGVLFNSDTSPVITGINVTNPKWAIPSREESVSVFLKNAERKGLVLVQSTIDPLGRVESREWPIDSDKIQCNVRFGFESKWAPVLEKTLRLEYKICKGQEVLYSVSYPLGFDLGIIVREPFGLAKKINRPLPSDQDFVNLHREWMLSKLPDWEYQTTRDGAPSDFYLKSKDGSADLNLMDEDILVKIANLVHKLFDNWQDGLAGLSMLLHHPHLTRHSGSWARVSGGATSETVLRMRGCFCCDTSRVSAEISEILAKLYGVELRGFALGLRGHLSGLIESPIGDVLIDPMLGITYFSEDNTRLATLDELRENKSIQEKTWLFAYCHGHEFFYKKYNQNKRRWKPENLSYPV